MGVTQVTRGRNVSVLETPKMNNNNNNVHTISVVVHWSRPIQTTATSPTTVTTSVDDL